MPKSLLACTLLLLPFLSIAQRFGGTPPNTRWKQINSDTARIIFPEGLDSQANRIANIIHYQAAKKTASLGNQLHKINIVLQNQTTIPNAYVGLGPFRSEFYLTPSPDNFSQGSVPWADQLALHEYRHVEQFNNFRNGLSNLLRVLFGEEGYALATNASIPDWFYEGDAVYNETVLSNQGRGRLPLFMNAYPSLWKAGKQYSWMKLRNGSLKDYVPTHYNLGYLLVNYGYEKYGLDFWGKVTRDASAFKGLVYPFQKAVQRHAGSSFPDFRKQALNRYQELAAKETEGAAIAEAGPFPVFPLNKKVVSNYLFPYSISPDTTIYLKKTYNRRPSFMIKDSQGEHWLRVKDISIDDQFSYRNGTLVYTAYETDPRWRWRDYSVIKVLDLASRQQRTLTHKTKYFSPDISASGSLIAAVQTGSTGKSELHILDASDGVVKTRISSADIMVFTDPKFISEDSLVTAVRLRDGRMALAIADTKTGSTVRLTPPSFNVVGYPCVSNGKIYFTASYGGKDNIFVINLSDQKIYELTSKWPLGNYFVNVANGKISWSALTADGYQLQQTDESALSWEALSPILAERLAITYPVGKANDITELVPGNLPVRQFESSRYRAGTRLFNFHSWRPYYEDPEFTFSLYGQNVLNTLETQLYYLYNENEKTHAAGVSAVYGKWFPYLNIGSQYTFGRQEAIGNRVRQFDQLDLRAGFSIPLSWVKGQTSRQFSMGSSYVYNSEFNKGFYKDSIGTSNYSYLYHFISMSEQVESAVQHIYPRLGYAVSLQYRHTITEFNSRQLLAAASVYFPGLAATHNLIFNAAWQETGVKDVKFANRFPYSRGYNAPYFARIWGVRSNYHFPIVYPDWGFGNILYLKRVRGNAFFDYAKVFSIDKKPLAFQRSVGGELFVDTKWWNQYELTFGLRVSHLLDRDYGTGRSGGTVVEFVLPVSIIPR